MKGCSDRMRALQTFHSFLLHPVLCGRGQGFFTVKSFGWLDREALAQACLKTSVENDHVIDLVFIQKKRLAKIHKKKCV